MTPSEWLGGKAYLLPEVSQQAIDIMKQVRPKIFLDDTHPENAPYPADLIRASDAIVSLGNDAAKALVWIYAEDPPRIQFQNITTWRDKGQMITDLYYDGSMASTLVPLLRQRLSWAAEQLKNGTLDQTWFSAQEFGAIEGYLIIHGTDDDLLYIYKLEEQLRASKTRIAATFYPATKETPELRWKNAMYKRKSRLKRLKPYYQKFQSFIPSQVSGKISESKVDLSNPQSPDVLLSSDKNNPASKTFKLHDGGTHSPFTYSTVLVVAIMVAIGLGWLLVIKRKK